jgi:hypothetical protein
MPNNIRSTGIIAANENNERIVDSRLNTRFNTTSHL